MSETERVSRVNRLSDEIARQIGKRKALNLAEHIDQQLLPSLIVCITQLEKISEALVILLRKKKNE